MITIDKLWNQSNAYGRRVILKIARRDTINQFRAWEFLPADVQQDITEKYYQLYAYRCASKGQ